MADSSVAATPSASVRSSSAPAAARTRSKRWRRLVAALVGLFVVATIGGATLRYALARRPPAIHYVTQGARRGPIAAKVTANGTLSAIVTVTVGSQVSGRIDWLGADFGSHVTKGQKIATIEPALFEAAVHQARANELSARAAIAKIDARILQAEQANARAEQLQAEGIFSRTQLEAAKADLDAAKADRAAADAEVARAHAATESADLNLKYTVIRSPIEGVVISRNVDVGQTVAATLQSPTLFTIAQDLTRMQVDTNVAEGDVGKISTSTEVSFTVDAYPSKVFHGSVRQVRDASQTIQNVVTYDAVIDVDNGERLLKPGMTADVTFVHARRDDVLLVSNAAIRFRPDEATVAAMTAGAGAPRAELARDQRVVWVAEPSGTAKPVVIRVGLTDGSSTEVVDGTLAAGDPVVVEANPGAPARR